MMITNNGFTRDAKKFAKNHEIALHIVRPNFEYTTLHLNDRSIMQTQLQEYINDAKTPYIHEIVHRAFDFDTDSDGTMHPAVQEKTNIQTRDIKQAEMNRMVETSANRGTPPRNQNLQTKQSTPQKGQQGGTPSGWQGGSGPKESGSTRGSGRTSNRSR